MTKHSAKANAQTTEGLESALSSLDISSNAADQDGVNVNKGQAAQSATYFDRFPEFKVNNAAPIRDEFRRLAKEQGWGKKSANFKTQHLMCMTMEFDRYHGQLTSTNLQAWQQLCIEIARDQPVPGSITKCKKLLSKVYVNIYDYIDCQRAGKPIQPIFKNFYKFCHYTMPKKIFPLKAAKNVPEYKALLQTLGF